VIEYELSTMPPRDAGHDRAQNGQEQTLRQDRILGRDPQSPVGSGNGYQCHSGDAMRPTGGAGTDARNGQQLHRADKGGADACHEGQTGRPRTDADPEGVSAPPVEDVDAQSANDQRDRKMHGHGVKRMSCNCNEGVGRLFLHLGDNGVRLASMGLVRDVLVRLGRVLVGLGHVSSVRASRNIAAIGFPVLVVAGCTHDLSVLSPAGPVALGIATLWWWMFWGATAIFILVLALFMLLLFRPSAGRAIPSSWWIIGGGLIFPVPIILMTTVAALWLGERSLGGSAPYRVEAEAAMWEWRFSYPGTDLAPTVNVLHIPAGQDVEILVTSPDVIHSFWIPRLGGKIDAIPGHANSIVLHADQPGDYGGVCAEYCGVGHVDMSFTATAHAEWPPEAP